MHSDTMERRGFEERIECHYLLQAPDEVAPDALLALAMHGYGSNPEVMLRLTRAMFGPGPVIASIQGPSAFYPKHSPDSEVGFSWITSSGTRAAIGLHHRMVLRVIGEVEERFEIPPGRRILVGFSQPVGLNYRFAATHPDAVRGVVGICGGVPKDWEDGGYGRVGAALLHIARREDEIFPPSVTEKFAERLRLRADDVEFHLLEGGHKFPSKGGPIVERWLARVVS